MKTAKILRPWLPKFGAGAAILILLAASPELAHAEGADAPVKVNAPQTKWSGSGLRVELQPLSPDLVRAFFIGRGFPKKDVEFIVQTGCVFRSSIGHASKNRSDQPITIEVEKWRVIANGKAHPVRTREMWKEIWRQRRLNSSAGVAFHWALIPTTQTYSPTDYNWGMLTFLQKPGTRFDLQIAWRQGDSPRTHTFKALQCGG